MQTNTIRRRRFVLTSTAVAAAAAATVAQIAPAATSTWVGGSSTNWSDAANWSPPVAPTNSDFLLFGGLNTTSNNNIAGLTVNGLTFNGNAGAFTLGGSNLTHIGYGPTVRDLRQRRHRQPFHRGNDQHASGNLTSGGTSSRATVR